MIIHFENVSLAFGDNCILDGFYKDLHTGKVTAIVGVNGSGKSTFLKLAGQFIPPDSGSIVAYNADIEINPVDFRKRIAAVTPTMSLYSRLTSIENLRFFASLRDKILTDDDIDILFQRVGLDVIDKNKFVGDFSTGMQQRLKFAILLTVNADIWLLDEPFTNLDAVGKKIMFNEIKNAANNKLILLATNDKDEMEIADEIISLH